MEIGTHFFNIRNCFCNLCIFLAICNFMCANCFVYVYICWVRLEWRHYPYTKDGERKIRTISMHNDCFCRFVPFIWLCVDGCACPFFFYPNIWFRYFFANVLLSKDHGATVHYAWERWFTFSFCCACFSDILFDAPYILYISLCGNVANNASVCFDQRSCPIMESWQTIRIST